MILLFSFFSGLSRPHFPHVQGWSAGASVRVSGGEGAPSRVSVQGLHGCGWSPHVCLGGWGDACWSSEAWPAFPPHQQCLTCPRCPAEVGPLNGGRLKRSPGAWRSPPGRASVGDRVAGGSFTLTSLGRSCRGVRRHREARAKCRVRMPWDETGSPLGLPARGSLSPVLPPLSHVRNRSFPMSSSPRAFRRRVESAGLTEGRVFWVEA